MCTALTLNNHRDYIFEDNTDIVATDSQKNTVHVLAKQHGVGVNFQLFSGTGKASVKLFFIGASTLL